MTEHTRPDLVVLDKEKKHCQIIDIEIPGDWKGRIDGKRENREVSRSSERNKKVMEGENCSGNCCG